MQGAGTQSNPYLVSTPQDLDLIRNNLSAYYKLTNDIDMSTFGNFLTIGRISPYFSGTIDGNGCKISNLSIVESGSMIAFVGLLNAGKIMNLYLENIYVESNLNSVGGIVGKNFNGTITNCSVTGTIKQTDTTRFYTGGFVAESENGVIENCFADCNVSGGRYLG